MSLQTHRRQIINLDKGVLARFAKLDLNEFDDFTTVNPDATDETKIVTTKFVLGFCHGQLQFCLVVLKKANRPPPSKLICISQSTGHVSYFM